MFFPTGTTYESNSASGKWVLGLGVLLLSTFICVITREQFILIKVRQIIKTHYPTKQKNSLYQLLFLRLLLLQISKSQTTCFRRNHYSSLSSSYSSFSSFFARHLLLLNGGASVINLSPCLSHNVFLSVLVVSSYIHDYPWLNVRFICICK